MVSEDLLVSPVDLEIELQGLIVGRRIREVTYVEIDYGADEPMWSSLSPHFDSLDHGLNLVLDSDETVSITWDWTYAHYGISLARGPLRLRPGPVYWPASERWHEFLNLPVEQAQLYWSYWEFHGRRERQYFPQDLRLEFVGGKWVAISAFQLMSSTGQGMPGSDNMTVFFREQDLLRCRLCSHGGHTRSAEVPWPS